MAQLNQELLFNACRIIYEKAGENYVLPPLIREAASLKTQSSYVYNCPVGNDELYFSVALDEAYADRNALAYSKLPLKFRVELRDAKLQNPAIELSGSEKFELIRAFLLGAMIPIFAEKVDDEPAYNLSIQLSSTFFVDCGELSDEYSDYFPKIICDNVGQKIYERSSEFFEGPQQGLAVWGLRAAQCLFGEAKPAPEIFWPDLLRDTVAIAPPMAVAANEQVASSHRHQHRAMAATLLVGLLGTGVLAANFGLCGPTLAPAEMATSSAGIEPAVLWPERMSVAPGEANNAFAAVPTSHATTMPPSVAAPEPLNTQIASAQSDRAKPDDHQTTQAAIPVAANALAAPDDTLPPPARPKRAFATKPQDHSQNRLAKTLATRRHRPSNPLEFTRSAVVALNGVIKGIERIPGAIFNANKRFKI